MNFQWTMKFAWRSILSNKKRSFLTMLGMIVGVSSVIAIMSIGAGAESYIFSQLQIFGGNLVGVLPGESDEDGPPASVFGVVVTTLTFDDAKEIKEIPHVEYVTPYVNGNIKVTYENKSKNSGFSGVTSDFLEVESSSVENGRFISSEESGGVAKVAVLGSEIADNLFGEKNPVGEKIKMNQESFLVVGVLSPKGSSIISDQDNQIYVPVVSAQKLLLGIDYLSLLRAKVDKEENVNFVMEEIKKLLRQRHNIKNGVSDDFSVRSMSQALSIISTVTGAISMFLGAIAAISLLVGGVGIMNIMLVAVTERTREVGLRKAIGAKRIDIVVQFLVEAVALTFTGGFLGILLGVCFSYLVAGIVNYLGYYWEFIITPFSILVSISVSVAIGIIFGLYPAYKAAKLNAVESLRYE